MFAGFKLFRFVSNRCRWFINYTSENSAFRMWSTVISRNGDVSRKQYFNPYTWNMGHLFSLSLQRNSLRRNAFFKQTLSIPFFNRTLDNKAKWLLWSTSRIWKLQLIKTLPSQKRRLTIDHNHWDEDVNTQHLAFIHFKATPYSTSCLWLCAVPRVTINLH